MFEAYKRACDKHQLTIGKLMLYYAPDHWILMFPTKENWRNPSKLEYLEAGLLANIDTAVIERAEIDWADIASLATEIANIAAAQITEANINKADINWGNIVNLTSTVANIADAKIADATISSAQIDGLAAVVAQIVHAQIETGDFGLAEIQNLLADALILEQGSAGSMAITNLIVTQANMLGATIQTLIMPGMDGKYYQITVGTDGQLHTAEVTVTDAEIAAGQTADGRQIVATTINADSINGSTVTAQQAILHNILTQALTAGQITAGQALIASATIPTLYTTSIEAIGNSLTFSANQQIQLIVGDLQGAVSSSDIYYAASSSAAVAPDEGWSLTPPERMDGMYIWQKTRTVYVSGQTQETDPVCISGADGEPATTLRIDSSRGTVFKNNALSTVLSVVIYRASERITTPEQLHATFGSTAHLQWKWQKMDEDTFGLISSSDERLQNGGFQFTLGPDDVDTKVTFLCELIV